MIPNEFIEFAMNPDEGFGGNEAPEPGEENLDEELSEEESKEEDEEDDLDDPDSDIEN